jgi:hypothetical protein
VTCPQQGPQRDVGRDGVCTGNGADAEAFSVEGAFLLAVAGRRDCVACGFDGRLPVGAQSPYRLYRFL